MPNIGMNMWVTAASDQGGRKYMEDVFDVKFDRKTEEDEARFAYFAVFDGHGGPEAANFAKKHLLNEITKNEGFWCEDDDEKVLNAISEGFKSAHKMMWNAVGTWPLTASGYPSTSGCTASVIFIRQSKMYVGHVGDSGIVLGTQDSEGNIVADYFTEDHKPESDQELQRIRDCGGEVMNKSGIYRVVWDRPRKPFKGPIRRSTPIEHIPFLAVSRALGDLWSYNSDNDVFVVSPEPDVRCIHLDPSKHRNLILASDGLWHIMRAQAATDVIKNMRENQSEDSFNDSSKSPASHLLQEALNSWQQKRWRADNITVIVIEMDPPDLEGVEGEPEDPTLALSRRPSSASTVLLAEETEEEPMSISDEEGQSNNECHDLPRSTSNTPVTDHVLPFTPLDKCMENKQPFNCLLRLATKSKKLVAGALKISSFEGDDQDSRDTGSFRKLRHAAFPIRTSKLANQDVNSNGRSDLNAEDSLASGSKNCSDLSLRNTNNSASSSSLSPSHLKHENHAASSHEDKHTSGLSQSPHKDSRKCRDGACSGNKTEHSDKHIGASQGISASQVHGASSGQGKVTSPRSARQVGLNLTNSTASSSSLNRWAIDKPSAGWTSIKGADSEQQVTACSAMGSEISAGSWPDSLDLGPSSLGDQASTDAPPTCYGACEYAPENPPCKKCIPAGAQPSIKKAAKRKASPPVAQLSKRFRSCIGGHRTRSTLNRIRGFHSRSSRKAAST